VFTHQLDQNVDGKVAFHWFLLSFNGGAINAGGFMATGRFVSHVTGFATLFGVHLTGSEVGKAFGILSVPLFFLVGAFTAGLLIDRPIHQGKKPHFDWVMGLCALCLFLAAGGGDIFHLGIFGEMVRLQDSYTLLALLCLASGLQNGAITSSSHKSVRSTHLTGLTTDLGLGLAKLVSFDLKQSKYQHEVRANYLRIGSIAFFVLGSAFGAWIFLKLGYRGFMLPTAIAAYAAWHGKKAKNAAPLDIKAA